MLNLSLYLKRANPKSRIEVGHYGDAYAVRIEGLGLPDGCAGIGFTKAERVAYGGRHALISFVMRIRHYCREIDLVG